MYCARHSLLNHNLGIGIHRLREAGLGTDLMDLLDEKPFTLQEVRQFCGEFFLGNDVSAIRNPTFYPDGFFQDLKRIISKEKPVWNPLMNKPTPWIDLTKLKLISDRKSRDRTAKHTRRATTDAPTQSYRRQSSDPPPATFQGPRRTSSGLRGARGNVSASLNPGLNRTANTGVRRSNSMKVVGASVNRTGISTAKDLKEEIQQWSHQGPDYKRMKPLDVLLVDVPKLFPPRNRWVEEHEHFFKWKEFSEDAFVVESDDALKALLRRASRKSKLFFHPDKLPSDLTPNQDTLFKAMWDVFQESEANTL